MGRRALKKPDPSIDTSGRLITIDDLPSPFRAEELFGRSAPLEIEVGSGKGLFIRTAAAARPDTDFLGIEISRKYAHYSAAALVKRGIKNAVMLAGNGLRVFD
ncbi:MAG: tRNA (guanosine(46)-N7)-methyltransferase TrmB, partial [Pirellulales bacterium]|nr:tRNA (guanosine(46)-N7)-methyltransferase TrmB [Pirellulales bacterium]